MKLSRIIDTIVIEMVNEYYETGNLSTRSDILMERHPNWRPHLVAAAIRLLDDEGLITLRYSDNPPQEFSIDINAVKKCDEFVLREKGYEFVREIRQLLWA